MYTLNYRKPGARFVTTVELVWDKNDGRYVIVRWYS